MLTLRPFVAGALALTLLASGSTTAATAQVTRTGLGDMTTSRQRALTDTPSGWQRSQVFGTDPAPQRVETEPTDFPWAALSLTFTAALVAGAAGTARLRTRRRTRVPA